MDTLNATHTGTIVENSTNVNIEHSAGGNIYITETNYTDSSEEFADVSIAAYSEDHYTPPAFTEALADQLRERKLLVLSGGPGFDKNAFAKHLAFQLQLLIPELHVKEWRDSAESEDVNIVNEIREELRATLFLIPDAAPQHINHDMAQLAALAQRQQHMIILITELTVATWQQPEPVLKLYWYEIPSTGVYSKAAICQYLIRRVNANKTLWGLPLDTEAFPLTSLTPFYTPQKLAENFESPQQVDFFLLLIEATASDGDLDAKIKEALFTVSDKSETLVTKWYRSLNYTERLIALGAAMLDGLFDDQFFAVMQNVVNDFWHYRDKKLQSLDYCDLDFLLNFFSFEMFDDGRQLLVCKFPNQRAEIIRAAWQSNKRHILSAFGVLTTLAGSSSAASANRISHPEINGTRERGKRLRAVAAETISDIGIVSLQTAEPKLSELATSSDITTRRITAKAIARWRAFGKDEQMYETLSRWLQRRSGNIRSAVVFTLQYAAEYDGPSQLDPRIMSLLNQLSGEPGVVGSMKDILPRLIEHHLPVIRNDLRDYFAVEPAYSDLLTNSLVQLYDARPHEIKEILEDWLSSCWDQASQDNRRNALTYRDTRLVLVLKIYRSLPYGSGNDVISLSYIWNLLDRLHAQEQRAAMRGFILETAAYMIGTQPEEAIRHIEPIFKKLGTEGRLALIHSIGWIYLRERMQLQGAQYTISIHGLEIPVWPYGNRPVTTIETILYKWLLGSHPFAREVAALAFVEFATLLDRDEPQLTQNAILTAAAQEQERARNQFEQEQRQRMEARVVYPVVPELSLWTRIKIFFWLLFRTQEEKIVLKELMNVLLMYKKTNPMHLGVLISRWNRHHHERIRRMAWWVNKLQHF